MNTKDRTFVHKRICDIIEEHMVVVQELQLLGRPIPKYYSQIEDVGFQDIFSIWRSLGTENKRLFLPGDLDLPGDCTDDHVRIIYQVIPGFCIEIVSEPCFKLKAHELRFKPYHFN